MCSKFTLLAILLLVSATLAVPASLVEAPPARRSEDHQSPPINRVASRADASTSTSNLWYDSYVAGTSFSGTISGIWQAIYGILTVPTFQHAEGASAIVYLRFDGGKDCPWNSLELGITYDSNGNYYAFYRWLGHDMVPIPNFAVHPNDRIKANIAINSLNYQDAHLMLYNCRNGHGFNHFVTSGTPVCLCKRAVGWFVSPAAVNQALAMFDRVIFSHGLAKDAQDNRYHAACGIPSNIQLWPNQILTDVFINPEDGTVIITDNRWNR